MGTSFVTQILPPTVTSCPIVAALRYGGRTWRQEAVPCRVVDTLGAGDAFIARLIVGIVSGEEPSLALREAARSAAATCSYYGAFGHPRAYRPVAE